MSTMSGDTGFCQYAGHTGSVTITWDRNTVVNVECGFGDYKTCGYADVCELYQQHPVGFTQTFPNAQHDKTSD